MWKLWGSAVAAVLIVSGCSTVQSRPVEIEMPAADRHFIVNIPASDYQNETPRSQDAASAVVVNLSEEDERS